MKQLRLLLVPRFVVFLLLFGHRIHHPRPKMMTKQSNRRAKQSKAKPSFFLCLFLELWCACIHANGWMDGRRSCEEEQVDQSLRAGLTNQPTNHIRVTHSLTHTEFKQALAFLRYSNNDKVGRNRIRNPCLSSPLFRVVCMQTCEWMDGCRSCEEEQVDQSLRGPNHVTNFLKATYTCRVWPESGTAAHP